ncbi:MAG: HEAT repeat domain-containing protein [Planctomycetota bacterium]
MAQTKGWPDEQAEALRSGTVGERRQAARALRDANPGWEDILLATLKMAREMGPARALASALETFEWPATDEDGDRSQGRIHALLFALQDHDPLVRRYAVEGLGFVQPMPFGSSQPLKVPLYLSTFFERVDVCSDAWGYGCFCVRFSFHEEKLGELGLRSRLDRLVPALAQIVEAGDEGARVLAITALHSIGPLGAEAATALARAQTHAVALIRGVATRALSRVGRRAKEREKYDLALGLTDADPFVQAVTAEALGEQTHAGGYAADRIDADESSLARPAHISALENAVRARDPWVRQLVVRALGKIGHPAASAAGALTSAAKDGDYVVRALAAGALGRVGAESTLAGPVLLEALAAEALACVKPPAESVIGPLKTAMGDQEAVVRAAAVRSLGFLKPVLPEAVHALGEALRDPSPAVRWAAAFALECMGPAAEPAGAALAAAARDPHPEVCFWAIKALQECGCSGEDAISALLGSLDDEHCDVRSSAAEALGKLGVSDAGVVQALAAALRDQEASVRRAAAEALGKLGPAAQAAVPALVRALGDPDEGEDDLAGYRKASVRSLAQRSLTKIRHPSDLRGVMKDVLTRGTTDRQLWTAAANWVGQLRVPPWDRERLKRVVARGTANHSLRAELADAVCFLQSALDDQSTWPTCDALPGISRWAQDESAETRRAAVRLLGCVRPAPLERITRALHDENEFVRECAARVLGELGADGSAAVPELAYALRDARKSVRLASAEALTSMGAAAAAAVPALIEAGKRQWRVSEDRQASLNAAATICSQSEPAIDRAVQLLNSADEMIRRTAAETLGLAGANARRTIPLLLPLLEDADADVRFGAAEALQRHDVHSQKVIAVLAATLETRCVFRRRAVEALARMGSAAKAALPALSRIASDARSGANVHEAALRAHQAIVDSA